MPFPKRQVTRAYKSLRSMVKGPSRGSNKRYRPKSYTDQNGRTVVKRMRKSYPGKAVAYKPRNHGDGVLGKVVSLTIDHRKGVTYERNEKFDRDHTTGAGTVLSLTGAQGVYGRAFMQGYQNGSGTDLTAMWAAHSIGNNSSRKIKSTLLEMQCVSASSGIQQVTVYLVRANRDTAASSESGTSPIGAWTEVAQEVSNIMPPTLIGETPYRTGFGNYWKIVKAEKVILNPGQCFRIRIKTNEHWGPSPVQCGRNVESSAAYYAIRNRTYGVLLVNHGLPVADSTTNTYVNYGSAKLNFTWKWSIWSSTKIHQQENTTAFTNTIDAPATITTAVEIGDDTGMRENHATA